MTAADRSPVWIGLADLLLCVLSVVIVAVTPTKGEDAGPKKKAEYLVTMESSVDIDADPDLWVVPPEGKPVFYGSREEGCATLDSDPRGFVDTVVTLADGSQAQVESDKETTTLRCIEPGRYDVGVNLYSYRLNSVNQVDRNDLGLKVHVEIVGLNPSTRLIFSKDIILNRVGETINVVSFDLDRAGVLRLTTPPLEAVTAKHQKTAP